MDPEMVEHEGTQHATSITKQAPTVNDQTAGFHTDATSQVVGGSTLDTYAPKKLNPLTMQDLPSLDPSSINVYNFTPRTPIDVTRLQKNSKTFVIKYL